MSSVAHNSWSEQQPPELEPNAPIRILIAETDGVSRGLIRSILKGESDITVRFTDSSDLLSSMQASDPDLVIVEMHTSTIERAASWEALGVQSPPATIVTSYDASSLTPFASTVADLLIKPFNVEQFQNAIEVAKSKITRARNASNINEHRGAHLDRRVERGRFLQRLAAESEGTIVLLKVKDILWLQSFRNHIRVHSIDASHLVRYTMKNIQAVLDPNHFLRVHRNVIVNLNHVTEFHLPTVGNMFVKLDTGACLPLRRASRASLRKILKQHTLL
jgi:two-component system LytT family response regulator